MLIYNPIFLLTNYELHLFFKNQYNANTYFKGYDFFKAFKARIYVVLIFNIQIDNIKFFLYYNHVITTDYMVFSFIWPESFLRFEETIT